MKLEKILVAVDYSECSKHATQYAAQLAKAFGAELHLLHAWDRPYYASEHEITIGKSTENPKTLTQVLAEAAQEEMDHFVQALELPEGVQLSHRTCSGNVAGAILDVVKNEGVDVLVTGTHGRTGFKHLLLGSVAERLVRLSPVPVLTVPLAK